MRLRDIAFETEDRVKSWISPWNRRKLAMLRLRSRLVTARFRPLPDALIIGGQRCGTSSLYKYLGRHPACAPSLRKEVAYFSVYHHLDESWYRAHFPMARGARTERSDRHLPLCFEATPDYLLDPRAAQRAAQLLPHAKIVALLRDPVERAISHYEHARRHGHESASFEDAIRSENERVLPGLERARRDPDLPLPPEVRKFSYLTRGHYAEQLKPWLEFFPASAVLILRSEDFFQDPATTYDRILAFLGLPHWRPIEFKNFSYSGRRNPEKPQIHDAMRDELVAYFRERNEELYCLLDRDMGWLRAASRGAA